MKRRIVIGLLFCCIWVLQVVPCTIFKITKDGRTLIGNSEDWSGTDTRVWIMEPGVNTFGRICFGFGNGWVQGGMNTAGLFFDGIAGPVVEWRAEPDRQNYPGNLCEKILAEAATVDEAVEYFRQYNFPSLTVGMYVFVDHAGKTAVIQFKDGRLHVDVRDESFCAFGYRSETAIQLLEKMGALSMKAMDGILARCRRTDQYSTRYACVLDPETRKVLVRCVHEDDDPVAIQMDHLFGNGSRTVDLANLAEQLDGRRMVDHKTMDAVELNLCRPQTVTGRYENGEDTLVIRRGADGLVLETRLVLDGVMGLKLVPVSQTELVCRDLSVALQLHRDTAGVVQVIDFSYGEISRKMKRK